MAWSSKSWRQIKAVLAALVLTLFAFGAPLDRIFCTDAAPLAAAAAEAPPMSNASPDCPGDQGEAKPGHCIHCQCHHGVAFGPVAMLETGEPAMSQGGRPDAPSVSIATSNPTFGLKRPPRA